MIVGTDEIDEIDETTNEEIDKEKKEFIEVDMASPLQINDKFYYNIQLPKRAIEIFKAHSLI